MWILKWCQCWFVIAVLSWLLEALCLCLCMCACACILSFHFHSNLSSQLVEDFQHLSLFMICSPATPTTVRRLPWWPNSLHDFHSVASPYLMPTTWSYDHHLTLDCILWPSHALSWTDFHGECHHNNVRVPLGGTESTRTHAVTLHTEPRVYCLSSTVSTTTNLHN